MATAESPDGGTDRPPTVVADLAVVPVELDDPGAPLGCAALRTLRRRPLVAHAVGALVASGVVRHVVVPVPPALDVAVTDALGAVGGPPDVAVEVVAVAAGGPAALLAVLEAAPAARGTPGPVVVHDPLHALSPATLVQDVVRELLRDAAAAAAVPAGPVTDTLKWVGASGTVVGTADRTVYRTVQTPQAFRRAPLVTALQAWDADETGAPGVEALPRLVRARGGSLVLLPSPGHAFRMATADDVVLAEALLRAEPRR